MSQDTEAVGRVLDALGFDDPETRILLERQLTRRSRSQKRPSSRAVEDPEAVRRLRDRVVRSERLVEASLAKLEALACALGACPDCWGDDADCQECGGLGQCGQFLPDMACFSAYVSPVLKRLSEEHREELGENARTVVSRDEARRPDVNLSNHGESQS